MYSNVEISVEDNVAIWRVVFGWPCLASVTRFTRSYEKVQNWCLKTSVINQTRLPNTKSELDTALPATLTPADHASPTKNNFNIQKENRDTSGDSDEEISTRENDDFQVFCGQPINRWLQIRQTEICWVVHEAKALLSSPLSSTKSRTAAAAQEAPVEFPPLDGRRSEYESSNTADIICKSYPIQDVHTSNHTRNPVSLPKDNGREPSVKSCECNSTLVTSKLSNDDKNSAFDAKLQKWKYCEAYTAVEANSVPPDANIISLHVVYRRIINGSVRARTVPWGHRDKDKYFIRSAAPSNSFDLFRLILSIAVEKRWNVGQMYLETVFLQTQGINGVIYVILPREAESVGTLWKL